MATNQNLKNALQDAGLTVEEFAAIIQVDPKTVGRWISGASTPYPRHRVTITKALALKESDLWSDDSETDGRGHGRSPVADDTIRVWAYSDDEDAPTPIELINRAGRLIDILHTELWFELAGPIMDALIARADAGCPVRILSTSPTPALKPLAGRQGIELRIGDTASFYTLIRADEALVFTFLLPGEMAEPPQLLEARPGDGGVFDRLSDNFEQLWDSAAEVITDVDQLEEYRTNAYEELEFAEEPVDNDATQLNGAAPAAPPAPAVHAEPPSDAESAPRRWPRRPKPPT